MTRDQVKTILDARAKELVHEFNAKFPSVKDQAIHLAWDEGTKAFRFAMTGEHNGQRFVAPHSFCEDDFEQLTEDEIRSCINDLLEDWEDHLSSVPA